MARIDSDQQAIMEALVEHLRSRLDLDERRCYETTEPLSAPKVVPSGDFFITVSDRDGSFPLDMGEQFPGDEDLPGQVHEQLTITVTAFTRIKVDSVAHDDRFLGDPKRGVRKLKRLLLRALVGVDLRDEEGNELLRHPLYAIHASKPSYDEQHGIGWISIDFAADFDWDLTGDD